MEWGRDTKTPLRRHQDPPSTIFASPVALYFPQPCVSLTPTYSDGMRYGTSTTVFYVKTWRHEKDVRNKRFEARLLTHYSRWIPFPRLHTKKQFMEVHVEEGGGRVLQDSFGVVRANRTPSMMGMFGFGVYILCTCPCLSRPPRIAMLSTRTHCFTATEEIARIATTSSSDKRRSGNKRTNTQTTQPP